MLNTRQFCKDEYSWTNLTTDTREDVAKLYAQHGIRHAVVEYSMDKNERARLEYDALNNTLIIIFNVPCSTKNNNHYETIPMVFIVKDQRLFTITNQQTVYVYQKMSEYLDEFPELSLFQFLFNSLFAITDYYFPYIEEMNDARLEVSDRLREKTTKQNLLLLSDLEIGIVYFVSATKQNTVVLEQIRAHDVYKELSPLEKTELKNVMIESTQLVEMTQLASEILQLLAGTYNNVLNNSLNETMRILTILSVLLTVPTIITGFFGMNMSLPLADNAYSWLLTIGISTILWFVLSWLLKKFIK